MDLKSRTQIQGISNPAFLGFHVTNVEQRGLEKRFQIWNDTTRKQNRNPKKKNLQIGIMSQKKPIEDE